MVTGGKPEAKCFFEFQRYPPTMWFKNAEYLYKFQWGVRGGVAAVLWNYENANACNAGSLNTISL